jgi:acetyl esterase/lipase
MRVCLGTLIFAVAIVSRMAAAAPSTRPASGDVIRLWENRAPRSTGDTPADIPALTAYFPDADKSNGCAMVVCPGGGYSTLNTQQEGTDVAKWLTDHGIAAFVLKYRTSPYTQPAPMLDGQRAIRIVRLNCKAWGIDWRRIGMIGFDTGGHLAATVGTHWDKYIPASPDPVNGQSCRPDFLVLVYPLITMRDKITNTDDRRHLLGDHIPAKLIDFYSEEIQVKDDTPPAFIAASKTDKVVQIVNSQLFYKALQSRKIPSAFLELPGGDHGFGVAASDPATAIWMDKCLAWLKMQNLLATK